MYVDPILLAKQREILLSIQETLAAAMNTCDQMKVSCDQMKVSCDNIREICSKPFFESAQSSTNSIAVDTSSEVLDEYWDDSSIKEEDHISISYPALGAQSVSINEHSKTSLAIPVFVSNLFGDNEDCRRREELRSSELKLILQGTEFSELYCLSALEWDEKGISHTYQVFDEIPQRSIYDNFVGDLQFSYPGYIGTRSGKMLCHEVGIEYLITEILQPLMRQYTFGWHPGLLRVAMYVRNYRFNEQNIELLSGFLHKTQLRYVTLRCAHYFFRMAVCLQSVVIEDCAVVIRMFFDPGIVLITWVDMKLNQLSYIKVRSYKFVMMIVAGGCLDVSLSMLYYLLLDKAFKERMWKYFICVGVLASSEAILWQMDGVALDVIITLAHGLILLNQNRELARVGIPSYDTLGDKDEFQLHWSKFDINAIYGSVDVYVQWGRCDDFIFFKAADEYYYHSMFETQIRAVEAFCDHYVGMTETKNWYLQYVISSYIGVLVATVKLGGCAGVQAIIDATLFTVVRFQVHLKIFRTCMHRGPSFTYHQISKDVSELSQLHIEEFSTPFCLQPSSLQMLYTLQMLILSVTAVVGAGIVIAAAGFCSALLGGSLDRVWNYQMGHFLAFWDDSQGIEEVNTCMVVSDLNIGWIADLLSLVHYNSPSGTSRWAQFLGVPKWTPTFHRIV